MIVGGTTNISRGSRGMPHTHTVGERTPHRPRRCASLPGGHSVAVERTPTHPRDPNYSRTDRRSPSILLHPGLRSTLDSISSPLRGKTNPELTRRPTSAFSVPNPLSDTYHLLYTSSILWGVLSVLFDPLFHSLSGWWFVVLPGLVFFLSSSRSGLVFSGSSG